MNLLSAKDLSNRPSYSSRLKASVSTDKSLQRFGTLRIHNGSMYVCVVAVGCRMSISVSSIAWRTW
jgi:hypothetical protein